MKRILFLLCLCCVIAGCNASVDEVGPATETPEGPSEEEMKAEMERSMQMGGANSRHRPMPKSN